jgi:simple sugar transport system substrate-binding protein
MKKLAAVIVAVAAALLGQVAVARAQELHFVAITHGQANDPFWSVVKNGLEAGAKEVGARVDYRAPEVHDMVKQAQLIDAAVAQRPDGLIVAITDPSALGPSIKRAAAAGVPVISINSGEAVSKSLGALMHVGQGEYDAGKAAGEKLKELGGKNAICVDHQPGVLALQERCKGFTDGFAPGKVKYVPTTRDPTAVKSAVKAALASDTTIDTILTLTASLSGEPAIAAVKETGMKVNVGSFDLSPGLLKLVAAGDAAFAIDQQQFLQGYLPVVFLANYVRYGLLPAGNVHTGPNLITKDKAAQVIALSAKGIR